MDPDLWKKVDALLDQALAQPPDKREAFVVEACKDNAELRDEVLSLLKAQSQAANFMERSAIRVAAESLAQDSNLTTSFSLIGKQLANYRIEKLLGAGGMGEIYLDGKRLIYVQTDRRANIQAVKFDRERGKVIGEPFEITRGDNRVVRPELSPDGSRFVMRLLRGTQEDIVLVQRDGTNWRDLTNDKYFDRYPRWSTDGKRIAFTSDRSGRYEIWTIDADGTNLRQLSFDSPGDATLPLWSPDGTRLLFQRDRVNVILDLSKDWASQSLQQLPKSDKTFVAWDWSLDGKKLIGTFSDGSVGYYSFETNRYEKTSEVCGYPMWIPASSNYICLTGHKAHIGDVFTKGIREILSLHEEQIHGIAVSRDAQFIYFSAYSTESDIWLLDLQ